MGAASSSSSSAQASGTGRKGVTFRSGSGSSSSSSSSAAAIGDSGRVQRPDSFLPLFVDRPRQLRRFINTLVSKAARNETNPSTITVGMWHALLEVSLRPDLDDGLVVSAGVAGTLAEGNSGGALSDEAVLRRRLIRRRKVARMVKRRQQQQGGADQPQQEFSDKEGSDVETQRDDGNDNGNDDDDDDDDDDEVEEELYSSEVIDHLLLAEEEQRRKRQQQQQGQQGKAGSADGTDENTAALATAAAYRARLESRRDRDVLQGILKNLAAFYDPHPALALCQLHGYGAGCLYLYERLGLFFQVLEHYFSAAEGARLEGKMPQCAALRREMLRKAKAWGEGEGEGATAAAAISSSAGDNNASSSSSSSSSGAASRGNGHDPSLWVSILTYFAETYGKPAGKAGLRFSATGGTNSGSAAVAVVKDCEAEAAITEALRHIESHGLLPHLRVLQILSSNPRIPFGLCRDFLARMLANEETQIAEDLRTAASLQADTAAMLTSLHRLSVAPVVFQSRRCAACGGDLDAPSVHFLCGGVSAWRASGGADGGDAADESSSSSASSSSDSSSMIPGASLLSRTLNQSQV